MGRGGERERERTEGERGRRKEGERGGEIGQRNSSKNQNVLCVQGPWLPKVDITSGVISTPK